jgi:ligand-binding sensor domain-containing protein
LPAKADLSTVRLRVVLFWIGLPIMLAAQQAAPLMFRNLTERDGLPFRIVRTLHFDRRGALWIGTDLGLALYDAGVLATIPFEPDRLPPIVTDIQEDVAGILWIGTARGLYRLDPRSRQWENWRLPWVSARDGFQDAITRLCIGNDTNIYCGGQGGFFRFDPRKQEFDSLTVNGRWLSRGGNILRPDSAGAGFWLHSVEHGLAYWSINKGTLFYKDQNPAGSPVLDGLRAEVMAFDVNGDMWLTTNGSLGMMRYSSGDRTLQEWDHLPGHPAIGVEGWTPMNADKQGRLWINDKNFLPLIFDPLDSTVRRLKNIPGDPNSISGNFMTDLVTDAKGRTWVSTSGGVSALVEEGFQFTAYTTSHELNDRTDLYVSDIARDTNGILWMGTEMGLLRLDLATGTTSHLDVEVGNSRANAILGVQELNGKIWLGTRSGLWILDPNTEKFRQFTKYPKEADKMLLTTYAWCIRDLKGNLWAGTWGRGVVRIDPITEECTYFKPDETDPDALPSGVLVCALATRDGNIWIGHGAKGLARYITAENRFERIPLPVDPEDPGTAIVYAMKEDPSGRLWLGVKDAGLVRYEPSTGVFKSFAFPHGLRSSAANTIQRDKRGRIWVGTSNQLTCFDPDQERFIAMPVDLGTAFLDFGSASFELSPNDFMFTSINTLVRFDPMAFNVPAAPDAPTLREMHVYNVRRPWITGDTLLFTHDEDQLQLRFGTHSMPRSITGYSYFLEGNSREWVTTNTGLATFNNLLPGTYTLRMKVQDSWGTWSEEGHVTFTMVPPWWQTLLARILFGLLLASTIVLVFRMRLNWIRKRERKEEAIARTVNELKLQALRAQMDPHFIFNCLNSIDRFILGEEKKKASHYLNRFARLIRLILQQSESTTVPLEREAEMLRYYLELESVRFDTPFQWEVKVDPLLTLEPVELPAMLVQPFVENAIWHGLQHKQGQGHVEVHFRKIEDGIECIVEDNGVGRSASEEINKDRSGVHKSMGMRVTTDRIELIKEQHRNTAKVNVYDLADKEGRPLGTRVVIQVPIEIDAEAEP